MDKLTPLEMAIRVVGTQQALADMLGIRSPSIAGWKTTGSVPANRCRSIEHLTGGKVTRYDLRPDVFGPDPKKARAA